MGIDTPHGEPHSTPCNRPEHREAPEAEPASVGSVDKAGSRLSPHKLGRYQRRGKWSGGAHGKGMGLRFLLHFLT